MARVVSWLLLLAAVGAIALNPGVPSVGYALFWLGIALVARAAARAASRLGLAVTVDLALIPVCLVGMEIGGLFLLPALVAFAITDAREPDRRKVPSGTSRNPH